MGVRTDMNRAFGQCAIGHLHAQIRSEFREPFACAIFWQRAKQLFGFDLAQMADKAPAHIRLISSHHGLPARAARLCPQRIDDELHFLRHRIDHRVICANALAVEHGRNFSRGLVPAADLKDNIGIQCDIACAQQFVVAFQIRIGNAMGVARIFNAGIGLICDIGIELKLTM